MQWARYLQMYFKKLGQKLHPFEKVKNKKIKICVKLFYLKMIKYKFKKYINKNKNTEYLIFTPPTTTKKQQQNNN